MANFEARVVTGNQVPWIDEATNDFPSRQNNDPEYLASHRRITLLNPSETVEVRATVGGVEAPLDGALGGNLFVGAWKEWSGNSQPAIVHTPGQTSVMTTAVTHSGHYCLSIRRPNGGAVLLHFDAEEVF